MEKQPHITRAQRDILVFLKSTDKYTSVAEITRYTDTTRSTVHHHLGILVRYRCIHKHPGAGHSYDYKWLRDEADFSAPLPTTETRKPKATESTVTSDEIDDASMQKLLATFCDDRWAPAFGGHAPNLPLAVATIFKQVANLKSGYEVDTEALLEAREGVATFHKSIMQLANVTSRILNTGELFDSEGLSIFFEDFIEKISIEELTSVVDDVRKHNG